MEKLLFGLALAAVSAVCSGAERPTLPPDGLMTMRIDGELTIDPAGKVMAYEISTPLEPAVKQLVDRAVATWRFTPVTADGKPARARSGMRITLAGRPQGNGYAISVDNVNFRNLPGIPDKQQAAAVGRVKISKVSMPPPLYPRALHRAGITGQVLLYIKVSPDGRPEDMVAFQSTLFNVGGSEKAMRIAREQLEKESLRAARTWRFKVDSVMASKDLSPRAMTVTVPVSYELDADPDAPGAWRIEIRGERKMVPWLATEKDVRYAGVSDIDANDVQPLSEGFKFLQDPVGKAL